MMSIDSLEQEISEWQIHEERRWMRFWNDLHRCPVPIHIKPIHPKAQGLYKKRTTDIAWDVHCIADESFRNPGKGKSYLELGPFCSHTFSTGITVATPNNYGFLLRDRSGMGVGDVIHTAGVIEGTYRGEWKVHLINLSKELKRFEEGDRIVQAVLTPIIPAQVTMLGDSAELPDSDRGTKGFGSSGR